MTDPVPAPMESAAFRLVGDLSPKLAQLTDDVLFGDVWERDGLAKRDRSLATISTLVATGAFAQLRSHVAIGLGNGLTRDEIVEAIVHRTGAVDAAYLHEGRTEVTIMLTADDARSAAAVLEQLPLVAGQQMRVHYALVQRRLV